MGRDALSLSFSRQVRSGVCSNTSLHRARCDRGGGVAISASLGGSRRISAGLHLLHRAAREGRVAGQQLEGETAERPEVDLGGRGSTTSLHAELVEAQGPAAPHPPAVPLPKQQLRRHVVRRPNLGAQLGLLRHHRRRRQRRSRPPFPLRRAAAARRGGRRGAGRRRRSVPKRGRRPLRLGRAGGGVGRPASVGPRRAVGGAGGGGRREGSPVEPVHGSGV